MQLGVRLHDTKKLPIEERLKDVREIGFKCAHMAVEKAIPEISSEDEALTPGYAMYLRRQFAKNDLDIAVLGCYLNLANPNQEMLQKDIDRYKARIRFASWLGAGVVGTETGCPNETYTYVPECASEEALEYFIKNLRVVVEYAEKMGVVIGIEPVKTHIVCTPKRARRVLDEINSPNLQIILDPVNLLDITNYQDREAIFAEAIELLGKDVAMVHLKDFQVIDNKIVSTWDPRGEMDFSQIFKFMKERKPLIHATVEDTTPENNRRVRQFLQELYDQI